MGRVQLSDLECGRLRLIAAVYAYPDVVHAAGRVLEHHQRVEADEVVIAIPASIRGVDHQGGVGAGFHGDVQRHATGGVVEVHVRCTGHDVAGAARAELAVHFRCAAGLQALYPRVGREARHQMIAAVAGLGGPVRLLGVSGCNGHDAKGRQDEPAGMTGTLRSFSHVSFLRKKADDEPGSARAFSLRNVTWRAHAESKLSRRT